MADESLESDHAEPHRKDENGHKDARRGDFLEHYGFLGGVVHRREEGRIRDELAGHEVIDDEHPRPSPEHELQSLGTEFRRNFLLRAGNKYRRRRRRKETGHRRNVKIKKQRVKSKE